MNIVLIGLGMVAQTHVDAISASSSGICLYGVLGRDPKRAADFARRHGVKQFETVQAVADDPAVDFVILATPPNARQEVVACLARAGKPILMEKPIERNLVNATAIVDLCAQYDVPLGIVFQHRARAASIGLRDAIQAGALGEIATVDIRVPWWREQGYYDAPGRGTYARDGGGVMISQAIHTLDLALWLLGPIATVQAMMTRTPLHTLEAEDWAGGLFEFENGAVGTFMASTAAYPGGAETITIQGTKAAATLGSGVLTLNDLNGDTTQFGATAATGGGADPMAFTHEWHQSVIEDFASTLKTGGDPMATGTSALKVHAVIDAMQTASQTGQRTKVMK